MNLTKEILISLYMLCIIINITLAIGILLRQKYITRVHIASSIFAFLTSLWCLCRAMTLLKPVEYMLFWERMSVSAATLCVATALVLAYYFIDKKLSWFYLVLLYLPAILFGSAIHFLPGGVIEIVSVLPLKRTVGPLYKIFNYWLLLYLGWAMIRLITGYLKIKGIRKLQLQYIIGGTGIYMGIGFIFGGVLPFFKIENFIPFIPLFSVLWVGTTCYSTHVQHLISMETTIFNITKWVFTVLLFLVFNILLWLFFSKILLLSDITSSTLALAISSILLVFLPLRALLSTTLENIILKKRIKYQQLLIDSSKAVVSILDIEKLIRYVITSVHDSLGAEKIAFFLKEKQRNGEEKFKLMEAYGITKSIGSYFTSEKIVKYLEENKHILMLDIAWLNMSREEFDELFRSLESYNALVVVPLIFKSELIGIITIDQKKVDGTVFDIQDIEILQTLANNLAIAMQNAKLYTQLDDAYIQITRALAVAIETKDAYTVGHSDNVTKYTMAIAKKMNLMEKEITILVQAAMLHDLGKIGIHDYILTKPAKLTEGEWEEIKTHSLKGSRILEPIPFLNDVSEIIKHHHEHYDGTGYPDKLKGDKIPRGSQILSVADSFDAMISERCYREGKKKLSLREAIDELLAHSGKQFNPEIVQLFIEILKENPNLVTGQISQKET